MGKVLMEYEADRVCRHYIEDEAMRKKVCAAVFYSQEWLMLDMGIISEEEGILRMQAHLDTEEERGLAALCFRDWHLYNKWPKKGMEQLLGELHAAGYRLYLLSNASVRMRACCLHKIPGVKFMTGTLFSAEAGYIKPQPELYRIFFDKFDLEPAECFFVDDLAVNIAGGERFGMRGYCFADGAIEKLRGVLLGLNSK